MPEQPSGDRGNSRRYLLDKLAKKSRDGDKKAAKALARFKAGEVSASRAGKLDSIIEPFADRPTQVKIAQALQKKPSRQGERADLKTNFADNISEVGENSEVLRSATRTRSVPQPVIISQVVSLRPAAAAHEPTTRVSLIISAKYQRNRRATQARRRKPSRATPSPEKDLNLDLFSTRRRRSQPTAPPSKRAFAKRPQTTTRHGAPRRCPKDRRAGDPNERSWRVHTHRRSRGYVAR